MNTEKLTPHFPPTLTRDLQRGINRGLPVRFWLSEKSAKFNMNMLSDIVSAYT